MSGIGETSAADGEPCAGTDLASEPGVDRATDPIDDPWPRLRAWLEPDPVSGSPGGEAMLLATASRDGVPSARVVAHPGLDGRGLRFFTHAGSRKVRELADNPRAVLVFHWLTLRRQLRIEGAVEPVDRLEVEAYFATRPRALQLAACVSQQGRPSAGLDRLRAESARLDRSLEGAPVPCPDHFLGFRVVPSVVEFWLGAPDRLHDRTVHLLEEGRWRCFALQP